MDWGGQDGNVYRFEPSKNNFTKLPGAQLLNNGYVTSDSSILRNSFQLFLFNGRDAVPLFDTKRFPAGNILFRPVEGRWENIRNELSYYEANYEVSKWESGKPVKWDVQR